MHPMFLAGIITMVLLVLAVLQSENRPSTLRSWSWQRRLLILLFLAIVFAYHCWAPLPRCYEDIALEHFAIVVLAWSLLAVLYYRLYAFRILVTHCGGIAFFCIFAILYAILARTLPTLNAVAQCGYVACYISSSVSVAWAMTLVLLSLRYGTEGKCRQP